MKLTKFIALMLIVVLSCTALVSCGDNELETSVFSVKSSSDWEITKRKVDGKEKEDQVYVLKGGSDANSCPGLLISYFSDPSQYKDEKGFYKDAKDVSSISAGDRTWEGYTYSLFGKKEACLTAKEGSGLWVCKFSLEKGGETVSIDESDVKDILASLKLK
ncbi:MAG: hypothetical protein II168_05870 [Ruminococcus sp.]|nr:hypothetical protein [Ruminococcus sp.]